MKTEIKQRIEQIRHGELPDGYKRGKLGIVPCDWKEVTFSTLFTSTCQYTGDLGHYPLYSLTIEDGITSKTERYERGHLVKKENAYKIVRPNDYAYNPMNIRFGAVARHKGNIPVSISGYYDIFTTVHESDLPFMDNFLVSGPMISYYNQVSTGSLIEKQRVHFSNFLEFCLPLPSLKERERIAEILSTQDKVIELYEKKIEQLQLLKKVCLQKMFPKQGRNVPEVRFPGFTEPWEQYKVKDVAPLQRGFDLPVSQMENGSYPVIMSNGIGGYHSEYKSKGPGVITGRSGTIGKLLYIENNYWPHNTTLWVTNFMGNHPKFIYYLFQNIDLSHFGTGSGVPTLNRNDVHDALVFVPTFEEQKHISVILDDFDHLITLHQRCLEEEKRKKKALMQLLLTGIVRV